MNVTRTRHDAITAWLTLSMCLRIGVREIFSFIILLSLGLCGSRCPCGALGLLYVCRRFNWLDGWFYLLLYCLRSFFLFFSYCF